MKQQKNVSPHHLAEEMVTLLHQMFLSITAMESRLKRSIRPPDFRYSMLTHRQAHLLAILETSGGRMRMNDLAQLLGISPSTLSINVKRLVRMGHLVKIPDDKDERGVHLQTAPKTKRMFITRRSKEISFFESVFTSLPEKKRLRLIDSHRFIIETFREVGRR
jgi:DNA-binding MarR family transcriptional regulator